MKAKKVHIDTFVDEIGCRKVYEILPNGTIGRCIGRLAPQINTKRLRDLEDYYRRNKPCVA